MEGALPPFPARTREDWAASATKALKGRPLDELTSSTFDGVEIAPLYTAEDTPEPVVVPRAPSADPQRPWDIRARVDDAEPADANAAALAELNGGAASLLVTIGAQGVAVASRDDLARVLDGVLLDLAPVALDAGFRGPDAADWLADLAKGAPRAPLAFHLDPLSAFAVSGAGPGPIADQITRAARTAVSHVDAYPEATVFLASGSAVHEAGGTKAQELGFAAAAAVAYARALSEADLSMRDAFKRIVLGLSVDGEYFASIAKLRAARLVWARLTSACGVEDLPARIEARASRRDLARVDAWTNLLRLGAAAFAGAVGQADAVVLEPFTQPLGAPEAFARRQARNTQLVLMEEAHLGRVADPAAGSWFLDDLTHDLARAGWCWFQKFEREGGLAEALKAGVVQSAVADCRARRQQALADNEAVLIGVTRFPPPLAGEVAPRTKSGAMEGASDPNGRVPPLQAQRSGGRGPSSHASEAERPRSGGGGETPHDPWPDGSGDTCSPLPPVRLAEPYEGGPADGR